MSRADVAGRRTLHGGGKGGGDAPDYTPLAQASAEAARIGAEVGREYLAENKRQYDANMEVAQPIIAAQAGLMRQSIEQGDDYYDYMVAKQRPVENALQEEAMTGKPDAATNTAMEEAAAKATADARANTTQQANMIARQGIRYGMSPEKIGKVSGSAAVQAASGIASAADAARTKTRAETFAKRIDVAGLYRNLPGASQGAYSLANNAGNSAVGNQNQTSGQYMGGIAAGNATIMQGQQMRMQGLSSILNSQTAVANADSGGGNGGLGLVGTLAGAAISKYSDVRLKENVVPVGHYENGLTKYEFNYIGIPDQRFTGVLAQEVFEQFPDAVEFDSRGMMAVNYGMLGIEMERVV